MIFAKEQFLPPSVDAATKIYFKGKIAPLDLEININMIKFYRRQSLAWDRIIASCNNWQQVLWSNLWFVERKIKCSHKKVIKASR